MEWFIRVVCIIALTKLELSRLVIDIQDLNTLDAHMIEEKGTIVDKVVRETNCEGFKVYKFHLQQFDISYLYKDHASVYEYFVYENEEENAKQQNLLPRL